NQKNGYMCQNGIWANQFALGMATDGLIVEEGCQLIPHWSFPHESHFTVYAYTYRERPKLYPLYGRERSRPYRPSPNNHQPPTIHHRLSSPIEAASPRPGR